MQPVPRDGQTLGEVMMRGNVVMKGYLGNRKSTEAAFAGGWRPEGEGRLRRRQAPRRPWEEEE